MCGLVDVYNGGGSILEIALKNDLIVNTDDIYIKVEGLDHYTVDDIYGLTGQCFKNCIYFDVASDYQSKKAQAQQKAIDYQLYASDNNLSYAEIAEQGEYFYKLAKRYGLVKEFKENGII